jgi:SAM pointed domain-containing ETS transcription factor
MCNSTYASSPSSSYGQDYTLPIGSPQSVLSYPDCGVSGIETVSEDGDHVGHQTGATTGSHTHLWQFLKEMLGKTCYQSAIRWIDRDNGIFKIDDSALVAKKWGQRKHRPAMNYDKLSRSIRQYYKKGIMKKTARSQRLVYQFCAHYKN